MPSFERGVYEPPNDDVHVFDDDDQDIDEEGSRLPLLIVIALLVLAAFAGVVWLAYSQGVQRGRADAPRVIVAPSGPEKEAAEGSSSTSRSLKIYDQPAPPDNSADNRPAVPATETSKPAPASPVIAAPPPVVKPAPATVATPKPESAAKPDVITPKPTPVIEKPVAKLVEAKPSTVPTEKPTPPVVVAPPKQTVVAAAPPKPVETATKTEPAATAGAYVLQIGSYKSQVDADAAWKAYAFKHPAVGDYSEDVRKADLGDKGIWYRLRIGSFPDKTTAVSLCEKLKTDGGSCLLAK